MKNAATIRNDNLKNDVLEKVEDNKTFHFDFGKGKQFPTFNSHSWSSVNNKHRNLYTKKILYNEHTAIFQHQKELLYIRLQ